MGASFWIKRYLMAALPLFAILAAVEWFAGRTAPADFGSAALWAAVAAALFVGSAYRRSRKAIVCPACEGTAPRPKK